MLREKTSLCFPAYNEAEGKQTEHLLFILRVPSKLRLKIKKINLKSKKREKQTPFTLGWFWLG